METSLTPRVKRYIGTTVGGAIGGAGLGAVIGASGAAGKNMTGKAMGWGALIGGVAGLATAGIEDLVENVL